ncbi:hypothetical protein E4U53_008169 [Claviceps sorghi]|nr:hypothetical protein E4U53_008169 [Claviceps sorghi]
MTAQSGIEASLAKIMEVVQKQSFSYFTVLTYWGLAFYFAVSAVHTLSYARRLARRPQSPTCLLDALPRALQALHSLFYTTVVTLPFLVTAVYWALLYKGRWFAVEFDAWRNVSQHALNSVVALFEVVFSRVEEPPWVHALWLLAIALGYLAVAYLTVATQGWYTYDFLDHDALGGRGYVAAYVFGIAVGVVLAFAVVRGLIWLRRWVTEVKLGMGAQYAVEAGGDSAVEAEVVQAEVVRVGDKGAC